MDGQTSDWLRDVQAQIGVYVRSGLAVRDAVSRAIREGFEKSALRRNSRRTQHELGIEEVG